MSSSASECGRLMDGAHAGAAKQHSVSARPCMAGCNVDAGPFPCRMLTPCHALRPQLCNAVATKIPLAALKRRKKAGAKGKGGENTVASSAADHLGRGAAGRQLLPARAQA